MAILHAEAGIAGLGGFDAVALNKIHSLGPLATYVQIPGLKAADCSFYQAGFDKTVMESSLPALLVRGLARGVCAVEN